MYWGKQISKQVLIFGKFWYCSLIKGLEYLRLKVLLFNFYPIWKCKKKLALHRIFFAIYLSLQRNQCFCERKIKFLTSSKSRKHHRIHMIFYVEHPPLYVTFSACPPIRLSVCPSVCPSVRLSICLSVCRAPYFRNRTYMIIIFYIHV